MEKTAATRWRNVSDFCDWMRKRAEEEGSTLAQLAQSIAIVSQLDRRDADADAARVDDLRARFADWSPQLRSILDHVDEPVFRWALYDREPTARWGVGTTTLLGDACHPMLPFMAQGSCQAIEDAAVLARCLDGIDAAGGAEALRRYESARQARTAKIQTTSFGNRDLFHMPDGQMQRDRDEILRTLAAELAEELSKEHNKVDEFLGTLKG